MITHQVESIVAIRDEFEPLCRKHWEEMARHRYDAEFSIDFDTYGRLEDAGIFFLTTARDEGRLIGYIATMVTPHLHCKMTVAINDALYLRKEYRKSGEFIKLLRFTESLIDADYSYIYTPINKSFSALLVREGYTEIECNHEKKLRR